MIDLYQGVGGGQGVGIILWFFFTCDFVFSSLMSCLIF